ncbi:MAG: transcriptional regulator [Angustibacter sp.]
MIVYHPYYEDFYSWAQKTLTPRGLARYDQAAERPTLDRPLLDDLDLLFIRQKGHYADVTSVLNAAAVLGNGPLHLAFADNLYPDHHPTTFSNDETVEVLARPFTPEEATRRGVLITTRDGQHMKTLIEKPTKATALALAAQHGPENLRLLEGRAKLTPGFINHLKKAAFTPRIGEAKLALSLAEYSHKNPVKILTTNSRVIDLGAPPQKSESFS